MNIFRILSSNDGSINEPNVSSFLAYLLNPNEDHGISSLLLQEVLNDFLPINKFYLEKIRFGDRIKDLSNFSGFSVNILPELSVNIETESKRKRRDIDIVLEIYESKNNNLIYAICLENKISDASIGKNDFQLEDELAGLKSYYSENNLNPEIYVIYLTPTPSEISVKSFEKLIYEKKYHLYWDNHESSIFNKLIKIFNNENHGLIDPINDQSTYLVKSFLSFIKTNFKSYLEERFEKLEKNNYGKPVIDFLNDFVKVLDKDIIYSIYDLKKMFGEYVLKVAGKELHHATRNAHFILSTVNDRNRAHYNVKRPDDERKNLFYYADSSKKRIKIFRLDIDENIPIYYRNEDEIDSITLRELRKDG
ncbi:MAG: PD-(D/E)XK nuclease family protein [Bacteroidales bacterium]